jgi:hypothetical protein
VGHLSGNSQKVIFKGSFLIGIFRVILFSGWKEQMTLPDTIMSILGMTIELCTTFTERGPLPSRKGMALSESGLSSSLSSKQFTNTICPPLTVFLQ